ARRREQRHVRIPEPERRKPPQLLAQVEGQPGPTRKDGVDDRLRNEIVRNEQALGLQGERVGERLHPLRKDREPRRRTVSAVTLEEPGTCAERGVEIERRDRPA